MADESEPKSSGKHEFHGIPIWAVALFGGVGLYLLYVMYQKHVASATQVTANPTGSTGTSSTDAQGNIFFLPNNNVAMPSQVAVNFNSRPPSVQSISGTNELVTPGQLAGNLPANKGGMYHPYIPPSGGGVTGGR